MSDIVAWARAIVDLLEGGDAAAVAAHRSLRVREWEVEPYLDGFWRPELDDLAGVDRVVASGRAVSDVTARFVLHGARGDAFVRCASTPTGCSTVSRCRPSTRTAS